MRLKLKREQRRKVMNEAERQYKQYVKIFARTYGTTIEEATETRVCKEYKSIVKRYSVLEYLMEFQMNNSR